MVERLAFLEKLYFTIYWNHLKRAGGGNPTFKILSSNCSIVIDIEQPFGDSLDDSRHSPCTRTPAGKDPAFEA
jgi:hypothetical protein